MSANSNAFYSQQYATAVELLAQQLTPRIFSTFAPMAAVGKAATVVNFIDAFEADERTGAYDPIVFGEPTHTRPWVYPRHFDKAIPFDSIEQMQMEANPQSEYVMGVVAALNRKMDDEAVRAFFAARNVGENGSTSENFPSGNVVSVDSGGTGSGLNVEKLQTAFRIAQENEIDTEVEQAFCVISPKQKLNLMNEIEVTSGDFFKGQVMATNSVNKFLTVNFVVSNRLVTDGSGYRRIPFYFQRGMAGCTWNGGVKTNINQRLDLRGQPWQVYGEGHFGSVRRDNKRVFEIKCSEA
jgi:hypothetical protein